MRIILFIICATALAACKKNTYHVTERDVVTNVAKLKVGYFSASINNQGAQVKVNGVRMTNNLVNPVAFPGGGLNMSGLSNSDYLQITPGETNIDIAVPKVRTDEDSVALLTFSQPLEANKRYTLFVTDTLPNVTGVMVQDDTETPDSTARIKFLHLMPNVPAVDFYQRSKLLAANVAYKSVTEYMNITFGSDTFLIRAAGSGPTGAVIATRVIATSRQRIYTFFSRGYRTATGTRAPNVSAVIVQ
jgi:hypothetical protein